MLRLLPLVLSIAASDIEGAVARKKRNGMLYVLAGVLALSAWFCGLFALGAALVPEVGPVLAPVYLGVALVATALLVIAVVALLNALDRRKAKATAASSPAVMTALALAAAPAVMRSRPLAAALAVAALGYGVVRLAGAAHARDDD